MSRKSQQQYFTEAIVGLFMIAVILLLGYFTIVISGVDVLKGKSRVEMKIAFTEVGGLKDHDNVMYRGTKVGVVESVEVTPSNLVVHANVDRGIILREGYAITVRNLSMLGGNILHIDEGNGAQLPLEDYVYSGTKPTDWMEDMKLVASNMRKFTEMQELKSIVTNIEATVAKFKIVADRIERGEGTVGRLLSSDEALYNELKGTVTEAKDAFANVKNVTGKLDESNAIEDLKAGIAAFRKAAESFDPKGFDLSDTKAKANTLLDNLNAVAQKLNHGEGTLGKFANDPEFYNEINGLIKDMRQVLDNYRDTTPITTFTSIATGAL